MPRPRQGGYKMSRKHGATSESKGLLKEGRQQVIKTQESAWRAPAQSRNHWHTKALRTAVNPKSLQTGIQ